MSEKTTEENNVSVELAGLWQQPKGHWSGMAKVDIVIKQGEYFNLFIDNNQNPKSPDYNLVIYRAEEL